MKTELRTAITQLSAERNLPKEVVLATLESALASAYKKSLPAPEQDILVKVDPESLQGVLVISEFYSPKICTVSHKCIFLVLLFVGLLFVCASAFYDEAMKGD